MIAKSNRCKYCGKKVSSGNDTCNRCTKVDEKDKEWISVELFEELREQWENLLDEFENKCDNLNYKNMDLTDQVESLEGDKWNLEDSVGDLITEKNRLERFGTILDKGMDLLTKAGKYDEIKKFSREFKFKVGSTLFHYHKGIENILGKKPVINENEVVLELQHKINEMSDIIIDCGVALFTGGLTDKRKSSFVNILAPWTNEIDSAIKKIDSESDG